MTRTETFLQNFERQLGVAHRLNSLGGVPGALKKLQKKIGLKGPPVASPHPDFEGLDVAFHAGTIDDRLALTRADAALAETGTLVFASGPKAPPSLNFIPEVHAVVLRESEILETQEELWQMLRERDQPFPRTLNLITGPSRTGDIEQTLYLGAHGPKEVHLFLVKG